MKLMIFNPKFPKDKSKAVDLTHTQFDACEPTIREYMTNSMCGKRPSAAKLEEKLRELCALAGVPIIFPE